jgi:hypothetical protein
MIFKQMRRKTVAKTMTVSVFINAEFLDCLFHGFLNRAFGDVMSSNNPVFPQCRKSHRRKNILPDKVFISIFIFSFECCSSLNPNSLYNPPLQVLKDFTRDHRKIIAALESVPELSAKYERDYKQIDWSYKT